MVFKIPVQQFPKIEEVYEIERKTVWRSADQRTILIFITDGACQIEIDKEKFILQRGDVFLIPSGQEYVRRPVKEQLCRLFYIHFKTEVSPSLITIEEAARELREEMAKFTTLPIGQLLSQLPSHLYLMQHTCTGEDFERLSALLRQIPARRCADPHIAPMLVSSCLVEFLASISLSIAPTSQDGTVNHELPPHLRQALSFIQQNYDRKLSTDHICEHCHISPQHLIRLFKKHLGVTPLQYITKNKLSHAVDLLRKSELSVKEIAIFLGYDNPNYFSRLFTKEEGCSPTELRERIRTYNSGNGASQQE